MMIKELQLPTVNLAAAEVQTREVETSLGMQPEVLSTVCCCACAERIWVVDRGNALRGNIINVYAFKVVDPRAYTNGVPDYIKRSHVLLECHYDCKDLLKKQLDIGEFIPLNI